MLWTQASWNVMAAPDGTLTDEAGASVTLDTFIRVFMTIREADANTVVQLQAFAPPRRPPASRWSSGAGRSNTKSRN